MKEERLTGVFEYVEPGYGFMKEVRTARGQVAQDDVLFPATVATKLIGRKHHVLKQLDGQQFTFTAAESDRVGALSKVVTGITRFPFAFL